MVVIELVLMHAYYLVDTNNFLIFGRLLFDTLNKSMIKIKTKKTKLNTTPLIQIYCDFSNLNDLGHLVFRTFAKIK